MNNPLRYYLLSFILSLSLNQGIGQTMGLIEYSDTSSIGYTLFSPFQASKTYLIDQCGHSIHQWNHDLKPFSFYLLDDGRLLRHEIVQSDFFGGGGSAGQLSIYNWDGTVDWTYLLSNDTIHSHHDIEFLPNGNIAAIAWEYHGSNECENAGRDPGTYENQVWTPIIIEIEPQGTNQANVVWVWRMWDHLIQDFDENKANFGVIADHPELMNFNFTGNGSISNTQDWMHLNAVNFNPDLNQFMFSSRHTSEIYIIDHSTTTEEAASHEGGVYGKGGDILYRYGNPMAYERGSLDDKKFFGQHDSRWVPAGFDWEGQFSVFNNGFTNTFSEVNFVAPPQDSPGVYTDPGEDAYGPDEFSWTYSDTELSSGSLSSAHVLYNGNVLICYGTSGLFIEVTPAGEKIWEYICPISSSGAMTQGNNPTQNTCFRATRIPVDHPGIIGKDLTPGTPLEFEPLDYECSMDTEYPSGCIDSTACNYDSTVTIDDGSCILPDGCTDSIACNYDSTATCDDGFCIYAGDYCDDGDSNTLDDIYLQDCSCSGFVSIEEKEVIPIINIYPNPIESQLHLQSDGPFVVEVYSIIGDLIYLNKINREVIINSGPWKSGLYILILKKEDKTQINRILKI
jgi:hypothetical protein|tara:strand:+ start:110 stop:1978 length:1869 start_codon:yes stop_codon:yes gene_type:complete